jgi:hypothetical protein
LIFPTLRLWRRSDASTGDNLGLSGKEKLRFPLPLPPRIAIVRVSNEINPRFCIDRGMREFEAGNIQGLHSYAPDALVLPLSEVLSLADQKLRGLLDLPSLKTAIIALSSLEDAPLASHHRDMLWKAFQLPVFEQLRGWDGAVIARECEVHDGLHFDQAVMMPEIDGEELIVMGIPTGLSAEIVRGHCDCGAETPRVRYLNQEKARVAAA